MEDVAEAASAIDEAAKAREKLMIGLIDASVEAHQSEGIYTAVDAVFATLAEHTEALANPETGMIDGEGSAIVNATYDALATRFDDAPEALMGAIGAAASRARQDGAMAALADASWPKWRTMRTRPRGPRKPGWT